MIKRYKSMLALTSFLTICPVFAGIFLWSRLPEQVATHFGTGNIPNGWSSRPFAVFGIPLMLLAIHFLCVFATMADPRKQNISGKLFHCVVWIVPLISLVVMASVYGYALGMTVDIGMWVNLIVGAVFIILGNYMPKCGQNYTIGIKLPWTLESEENWNRTHRLAGCLWIFAGFIFLVNAFFQSGWVVAASLAMTLIPVGYSFALYRKGI